MTLKRRKCRLPLDVHSDRHGIFVSVSGPVSDLCLFFLEHTFRVARCASAHGGIRRRSKHDGRLFGRHVVNIRCRSDAHSLLYYRRAAFIRPWTMVSFIPITGSSLSTSTRPKLVGLEDDRRHGPSPSTGVRYSPIRYRETVHRRSHGPTCTKADWFLNGQQGPGLL